MRILKSIFLLCGLSLLLQACSHEILSDINDNPDRADSTFITINFYLPGNRTANARGISSRAATEYAGTPEENSISDLNLILVKAEISTPTGEEYVYGNVAAVVKGIVPTKHSDTQYSFTTQLSLPYGYYRIFLIVNPDNFTSSINNIKVGMGFKPFTQLQGICNSYGQLERILYTPNHFLMTNAYSSTRKDLIECKPGKISTATINMQRAAARIDYLCKMADNKYTTPITEITAGGRRQTDVTFRLTRAALTNVSKGFYYFKQLSDNGTSGTTTIDAAETEDNFVIDTDWDTKQSNNTAQENNFFFPLRQLCDNISQEPEWKEITATVPSTDDMGVPIFYTSENTVPEAWQQQDRCTAILLECEISSAMFDGLTTLLIHKNIIYKADESGAYHQLNQAIQAEYGDVVTINENTEEEILQKYAVKRLVRESTEKPFFTYYNIWLRHRNNDNMNESGPMEFSVVRNTIYRLRVNSIKGFGSSFEPERPVEEVSQLDIQVEALDWVNREVEFPI